MVTKRWPGARGIISRNAMQRGVERTTWAVGETFEFEEGGEGDGG